MSDKVITKSPYINRTDLLFCHSSLVTRLLDIDFGDADMLPAGTPVNAQGQVANDCTTIGLLQHDAYKGFGVKKSIIIAGHVDFEKLSSHCGEVLTAEAKAALKNIVFVGDPDAGAGGGTGGGVTSYNDLTDTPCGKKVALVDIIPEQEVTFVDGRGECVNVKDACYDLKLCKDPGDCAAVLEINGEVIEGSITYYYSATGTFGDYGFDYQTIILNDGASVKNGDTVTVKMYAEAEIITKLDEAYIPSSVPVVSYGDWGDLVCVSQLDQNGKPKGFSVTTIDSLRNMLIEKPSEYSCNRTQTDQTVVIETGDLKNKFILALYNMYVTTSEGANIDGDYYVRVTAGVSGKSAIGTFKNLGVGGSAKTVYIIGERINDRLFELRVAVQDNLKGTDIFKSVIASYTGSVVNRIELRLCDEMGDTDKFKFKSNVSPTVYGC
ncbi:MAG: hypothetical protein IKY89_05635 [Alistipes sp.]|nr:hypothetical protein [Alistipes sp.]